MDSRAVVAERRQERPEIVAHLERTASERLVRLRRLQLQLRFPFAK